MKKDELNFILMIAAGALLIYLIKKQADKKQIELKELVAVPTEEPILIPSGGESEYIQ